MMMSECTCFRSPTMAQTAHVADDGLMVWLICAGAFDAQDGPASQEAWLHDLLWHGRIGFRDAKRWLWRANSSGGVPHFNGSQVLDGEVSLLTRQMFSSAQRKGEKGCKKPTVGEKLVASLAQSSCLSQESLLPRLQDRAMRHACTFSAWYCG